MSMLLKNTMSMVSFRNSRRVTSLRLFSTAAATSTSSAASTQDNSSVLKSINDNLKEIITKNNKNFQQQVFDAVQESFNSQGFREFTKGKPQQQIEQDVSDLYKEAFEANCFVNEQGEIEFIDETEGKNDALIDEYTEKVQAATSEEQSAKLHEEFFAKLFPKRKPAPKVQTKKVETKPFDIKSVDLKDLKAAPKFKPSASRSEEEDLQLIKQKFDFNTVPVRYAHLLYSTFKRNKILNKLDAEIAKLKKEYETNKALQNLIENNLLSATQRDALLLKYLSTSSFDPLFQGFLYVVSSHGRFAALPNIMNSLSQLRYQIEKDNNILHIVSAAKLTDKQRNEIKQLIVSKFNPSGNLVLNEMVNPALGGGYELYYGDQFHLDNSQRTISQELNQKIESAVSSYFVDKEKERQELYQESINEANAAEQQAIDSEIEQEQEQEQKQQQAALKAEQKQ